MKYRVHICFCLVIVWLMLLTACFPIPVSLDSVDWMPEEGLWYCEELQLQLSFEENVESYVIVNGEKNNCRLHYEHHGTWLYVYRFTDGTEFADHAEHVFTGVWYSLDDEEFVLRTEDGEKFVFVRVG